jgi:hypothetical protein
MNSPHQHFHASAKLRFRTSVPRLTVASFVLAILALFPGCLTVETKEYHISLKDGGSGEARIVFSDIRSESDDTTNASAEDFRQLIDLYLLGTHFEKDNPGFHNVHKRLYEDDGKLCGEVTLSFDSLAALRLFQYKNQGPLMYFVGSPMSSEELVESNGEFGRTWMPVVFWPEGTHELSIKTKVVSQAPYHHSLLALFKKWESSGNIQKQSHEK